MTKLEKTLLVATGTLVFGGFFLFSGGYLTFEFPFSFAFGPQVTISRNPDSPSGFFGSNQYESMVVYDVKVKGLKKSPAELQKMPIKVVLNPKASQNNNGLRDFRLVYRFCMPTPTTYGYSGLYGFTHEGCFTYSSFPSSIQQSDRNTTLIFTPSWNFYYNASYSTVTLYGAMAYTRVPQSKSPQKIRAEVVEKGVIFETWRAKAKNGAQIPVNFGQSNGNWLQVRSGYGYPLILK